MAQVELKKKASFLRAHWASDRQPKSHEPAAARAQAVARGGSSSVGALMYRTKLAVLTILASIRTVAQEVLSSDELESEYFQSVSSSAEVSNMSDPLVLLPAVEAASPDGALNGLALWEERRREWRKPKPNTPDGRFDALKLRYALRKRQIDLGSIPREKHLQVYELLVENRKRLRNPMSLENAMRLIDGGWVADKTWEAAAAN